MKKSFNLIICFMILGKLAIAQNSESFYKSPYESRNSGSFERSATLLSFGLGFPNKSVSYSGLTGVPPLYAKFEKGFFRDEVGLGGYISTAFGSVDNYYMGNTYNNNFFAFSFGALGYYHFNKIIPIKQMDVYTGLGLGFHATSFSGDGTNVYTDKNDVIGIVRFGIRYYVKPKFAFYAETGYDGMSSVNLGVTLKLK